jgi:microtubule-associated protein-like 6
VDSRLAGLTLPRLLVGTARCSLWVCAPPRTGKDASQTGSSQELTAGHFRDALAVEPHPLRPDVWATAGADRQLLLWQRGPRRTPVQRAEMPVGAACLSFAPDASLLAAGLLNGGIALFTPAPLDYPATAVARAQVVTTQRDGRSALCDVKFAPGSGARGGYLAAAGHDRVIDVYRIETAPGPGRGVTLTQVACCRGHTGTVTHLDWSADGSMLMSNCAAREVLLWAMPAGKRITSQAPHVAAAAWASWTCVLGFPAIGIWPDGSDGSDINAVHRSADGRLLLTADDFGTLKLFHCPCVVEDAPFRPATGHCSHVSCARFLTGDEFAVSVGGSDRAVMLWRIQPETDEGADAFRQRAHPISRAAWRSNGYGHAANPKPG